MRSQWKENRKTKTENSVKRDLAGVGGEWSMRVDGDGSGDGWRR